LIHRGFRFVGSTIIYAHLQATGIVNDHIVTCFRYKELCSPSPSPLLQRLCRNRRQRGGGSQVPKL
jgi:hypothetical protein